MKLLSTLLLICGASLLHAEPLTTAVFPFRTSTKETESQGAEAAALLQAHLGASPDLIPVERAQVDAVMGELAIGLSGLTDPATTAKAGQLLGAQVLVTGRVIPAGGTHVLVAKIISTETSRVFGATATYREASGLPGAAEELAKKVSAVITERTGDLTAKVVTREERIAALKKLVADRADLPVVRVSIAEQHLGRPVADPAAQTELEKILQELGFKVLAQSDASENYLIQGEAFSEPSIRRGDLIACRARIEIRVTQPGSPNLVLADAANTSQVDVAEHVAGKRALETGALDLAERIVPKLLPAK